MTEATQATDDCDDPRLVRKKWAPYTVGYTLDDGELRPDGHSEVAPGDWKETDNWACQNCGQEFDSEEEALRHLRGRYEVPPEKVWVIVDTDSYGDLMEHWKQRETRVHGVPVLHEYLLDVDEPVTCERCGRATWVAYTLDTMSGVPYCYDCLEEQTGSLGVVWDPVDLLVVADTDDFEGFVE